MSPESVYVLRMRGVEAIENGNYPEGLNALAAATLEEAKNRDAGQPVISTAPRPQLEPRWIDRIPRVTDEELEEARERIRASYRKPMPDQLVLF